MSFKAAEKAVNDAIKDMARTALPLSDPVRPTVWEHEKEAAVLARKLLLGLALTDEESAEMVRLANLYTEK